MKLKLALSACALLLAGTVVSPAAKCSFSLSPASASFDSAAGSASFSVSLTAGTSCPWTATTTNDWVHTTSAGTNNGTVNYTVDANDSARQRTGAISVGNQTFTLTQAVSIGAAVDSTNLVWVTSADYPWHGTNDATYDGVASAASGNRFVSNSVSWLQTTVTGPGTLSFWWRVSSDVTPPPPADPSSFDALEFLINGAQQDQIYGQVDWNYRTYNIPAGTNTLTWQYVKDAQYNAGSDQGWVDQVIYTTNPPIALQDALDTCGITWTSGGNTNPTYWTGQTNVSHDGKSATQSGAIYTSQESWMDAVVSGVTNVSFWWQVSSQTNDDFLEFYTNGVLARRISGVVNWQSNYFKLPATTNTLRWRYFMTNFVAPSVPLGENCGWVDQVAFNPPLTAPPIVTVLGANPMVIECHSAFTDPGAMAQDSCSGATLSVATNGLVNSSVVGSYNLQYTTTNASGNSATNSRTVNVVDTTPPQITLNGANPITVECHDTFTDPGASALDLCAGSLSVVTNGPVDPNQPGSYTLQYVATDPSGNSTTNTRTVNVVDTTPPQITLNGADPMTVECHGAFADPGATALDLCAGSLSVATNGSVNTNLPGSYILQYVATDPSGNSTTNSRTVNVVDTTPPVILFSFTNLNLTANSNCQALLPGLTGTNHIVAVDNCSSVTVTQAPPAGTSVELGTNLVVLTAVDDSGNTASCTNSVVVSDTAAPSMVCPADLNLSADAGQCSATNVALGTPTVSDNCGPIAIVSNAPAAFAIGTNIVIWTASDARGNTTNCAQMIVILDTELPLITAPASVVTNAQPGTNVVTGVALGTPLTSDNCGVSGVTNDAPSSFPIGTNTVTWTVTDIHGNVATVPQTVVVNPAPRLPHRITSILRNGDGSFTLTFAGTAGVEFIVQLSSNLLDWVSVQTNTAGSDGTWTYLDSSPATGKSRFFRSVQP